MTVIASWGNDQDDQFDRTLTFVVGLVCGVVIALFVVWVLAELL
jgi:uncharacterized membrane protein YccC